MEEKKMNENLNQKQNNEQDIMSEKNEITQNEHKSCTNDKLKVNLENACGCFVDDNSVERIPDEFFYNTCDCTDCGYDMENDEQSENFCSCGYMSNPLGMSYRTISCNCENDLNVFK